MFIALVYRDSLIIRDCVPGVMEYVNSSWAALSVPSVLTRKWIYEALLGEFCNGCLGRLSIPSEVLDLMMSASTSWSDISNCLSRLLVDYWLKRAGYFDDRTSTSLMGSEFFIFANNYDVKIYYSINKVIIFRP